MSVWDDSEPHPFWDHRDDDSRSLFRRRLGLGRIRSDQERGELLRDVLPSYTPPLVAKAEPPASAVEPAPLSLQLSTTDGQPLASVELTVSRPGFEQKVTTDGDGVAELVAPDEGIYDVAFSELPVALPPPPAEAQGTTQAYARKLARDCPSFEVGTGARRQILVIRPGFTEVMVDGYAQGAAVLRWGGMRVRADGTVSTARAALRLGLWLGRGRMMCVTGHADPLGQDTDNENLSRSRAQSLQLFAAGKLDEWAQHAFGLATELDFSCAMVACNQIMGMGPIALDDEDAIDTAHAAVRLGAGLADDAPIGPDDWRAIADLYDRDLAALLLTDLAGLAAIRATITWTDPAFVALGERHPVPLLEALDPTPMVHRRCGLCIFGPSDTPQLAVDSGGDELYDGTFRRVSLQAPHEVMVDIAIDTPTRESIARARAWIACGSVGVHEHRAGFDGHVRFMTLAGDPIEVVAAFDADGHGAMVDAGLEES